MNLGLYGGSFDPVHLGHLLVAQAAIEELELDRLFFIPAAQSPFKAENETAPAETRTKLLRLALAGKTNCRLDPQELRRGGVSYAIETVRDYARRFPRSTLYYLIGADHLPQLGEWREPEALAQLAEFAVVPRPGAPPAPFPKPFRGRVLRGFPLDLSSSQIRARIKEGLPLDHLVPPAVAEAIRNNRLYL